MRILHIITRFDRTGSSGVVCRLARDLKELGHDIFIASGPAWDPDFDTRFLTEMGIVIIRIPSLRRDISPLRDLTAFFKIFKVIKEVRPDIIHTHTSKAGFIGRIAAAVARVKCVVHTPHGHVLYGYFGRFTTRVFICLERIATRFSSKIIALTDIEKKEYVQKRIAADNKITVIQCGIDIKGFIAGDGKALRSELGISSYTSLLGWVGRIDPIKGCDVFLKACALISRELPQARYLVIGDGILREEMEGLAQSLGLKGSVSFLGFREDMPVVMNSLSLLVHTPFNEGLGKVLLEAMACAKPIVACAVGGIPEIVTHGLNGLLVPAGDYVSIADESVRILKDKALSERLGKEGRKKAGAFDNRHMVEKTIKLYSELSAK